MRFHKWFKIITDLSVHLDLIFFQKSPLLNQLNKNLSNYTLLCPVAYL